MSPSTAGADPVREVPRGASCDVCGGGCAGADLAPLLGVELRWLWDQVAAAADRRGDIDLTTGLLTVKVPDDPAARAAAVGLLGGLPLRPGSRRRVDLAALTGRLRLRGDGVTPGVVAAHAGGRPLAVLARHRVERATELARLATSTAGLVTAGPMTARKLAPDDLWAALRRAGWLSRLLGAPDPDRTLGQTLEVLRALPDSTADKAIRMDRRRLADAVTGSPHGLDEKSLLGGLVLGVLSAAGVVGDTSRPRAAWSSVGVDCDDLTGGLIAVGLRPLGWSLPLHAVVTLPPRELALATWPVAPADGRVFVTENPSVAAAAADLALRESVPLALLCTSGTPSASEIEAIGRLPDAGWSVVVRADFDDAGLAHVRSLLAGVPGSRAWRMRSADYHASLRDPERAVPLRGGRLGATPWDPTLAVEMHEVGFAAFEEALLEELLDDLRES